MSRIQTNVAALNAHRNLSNTQSTLNKSIGKLSSGFRINRAADDAAGLSIANKLRSDVGAMRQAGRNGAQANSVLSIADGAIQTLTTMMDRMKELASQAASDNVSDTQRATLHQEFNTLRTEFDRVVTTTKYQGTALINGNFGNTLDTVDTNSTILDASVTVLQSVELNGADTDTYTVTHTADTLTATNSAGSLTQVLDIAGDDGIQTFTFDAFGVSLTTNSTFDASDVTGTQALSGDVVVTGGDAKFLVSMSGVVGDDQITIAAVDVRISTLSMTATSLASRGGAETALGTIDTAIGTLATAVGTIGAAQSRIDFALGNLQTTIENVAAAESVIRDADMAFEMIDFTKQQILQQAGVAMLAQANAAPQGVLSLLAG